MIRNFELFCNLNRIYKSDFSLFQDSIASLIPEKETCPFCGASHSCSLHGHYHRDLIVLKQGFPLVHSLQVPRLFCTSCGHTHAFLPACLIPHASYSLSFILHVLRLFFLRTDSAAALCLRLCISVSTLYTWIHLFYQQKELWLGVLKNNVTPSLHFLSILADSDCFLQHFFHKAAVSFLQSFRIPSHTGLP